MLSTCSLLVTSAGNGMIFRHVSASSSRAVAVSWSFERETIARAMRQSGGVVTEAARLLGIDRRTLQRKLL